MSCPTGEGEPISARTPLDFAPRTRRNFTCLRGCLASERLVLEGMVVPMTSRQMLGLVIPLAGGIAVSWLLGSGTLTGPGGAAALAVVAVEVLGGGMSGFLLRSRWAGVLAPLAVVVGVIVSALVRTGAIVQGSRAEVVPLAIVALLVLIVPTAIGAFIGVAVGMRGAHKVASS